ncbi:MAG: MATE family efflux transporter, partial [Clostridiales bacterium]|nr:MATE family efflux transporter [Clostridiales bacterium]
MNNSKFENNLSKGNVASKLIKFATPFIISNLIQTLYNVVDLIVVGWFGNKASVAAVNNGSQLTFLATCLVIGISVGATVLIGQYLGAGEREKLKKTIGTLFVTLFVLAVVATLLMVIFKDGLLKLIGVPDEAFAEASDYMLVTALGTIFIYAYNALSAVMRGMGDSKRPLVFVAIACVTNIALDLLFVAVF